MIGKILGNRYRLIELIGEGGMALVYKAECSLLCRTVAIKILRPQYASDAEFVERFRREARAAASLSHPNIVNIYDVGQEDGMDFIVMEYIPGCALKSIIAREAPLSVERALDITGQILEGLNHAHQRNIIHRDIKPHNILVTPEGRIKVADFGIARALSAGSLTQTGEVMGSVQYSSPEQTKGLMIGPQSDLYSCGCVLYELLTGKVPYKGDTPIAIAFQHLQGGIPPVRQVRTDITPEVESILNKALAKDLSERYPSALAMLKDIHSLRLNIGHEDGIPEEDDEPTQIWKPSHKKDSFFKGKTEKKRLVVRIMAGLAGLLLLIMVSVFLVFVVFAPPQPEVEVPDLIKKSLSYATGLLNERKLQIKVINYIYNSEYPPETIISQKPAAGQKKRMGSEVEVVVSRGSKLVKIPDLTGKTQLEAQLALEKVGLKLADILTDTSIDQPENTVIRQLPEKNTQIEQGAGVSITLNVMPDDLIKVPNFIGRPYREVLAELSKERLSFNKAASVPDTVYSEGIIINQDPLPSVLVPPGTAMNFWVSSGPPKP
ncbi:MAG: Stk1 family PASTA domain-containing Ser/Thr kinase [Firmicutes bacterium]|nr:Stk1 family PASTA domain-containing Ser/Thr kinase [Bacillota bacterium]